MTQTPDKKPGWNPWPWVPVAILGTVVIANIILVHLAHSIEDGLLYDDWYERGLRYGEEVPPEAPAGDATEDGSAKK